MLRITIAQPVDVTFGAAGTVSVLPGEVAYVGSAMRGLAKRILRHATRTGEKPPHSIRGRLPFDVSPPRTKSLHWHIDYLLDRREAEITGVIAVYSTTRLEGEIAALLQADPHTTVLKPGLGASDAAGSTHLLAVDADDQWWAELTATIRSLT